MTTEQPTAPAKPVLSPQANAAIHAARFRISRGLSIGAYARNPDGARTGCHSSDATAWDLAGALWASLTLLTAGNDADRETLFRESWDACRRHTGKAALPDVKFAAYCDEHSLAWHLQMLGEVAGIVAPAVPTERAVKREERIVQKYA